MGPFLQANCVGAVVSWLWLHRTPGLRHGDAHGAAAHAAPFTTLGAFERFGECLVLGAEVGNVSLGPHEESQACGFGRCPTTCDAGWDILDSAPLGEDELLGDVGISPVRAPLPGMKPNTLSRFDFRIQDLKLRVSGTDKEANLWCCRARGSRPGHTAAELLVIFLIDSFPARTGTFRPGPLALKSYHPRLGNSYERLRA